MIKVLLVEAVPEESATLAGALSALGEVEVTSVLDAELSRRLTEYAADIVLFTTGAHHAALCAAEERLRAEVEQLKTELAERKCVERAKGILMKQRGLDENAAFGAIRSLAMQRGIRLGEAAQQVIDVATLLDSAAG